MPDRVQGRHRRPSAAAVALSTLGAKTAAVRRLGTVGLDEAVSGGSNVLATIVAARVLTPGQFGSFGIAMIVYGLVVGVFRASVCTPMLIKASRDPREIAATMGGAWTYAVISSVLLVAAWAAVTPIAPDLGHGLVTLAVCMPLLLVQDLGRYFAFSHLRPGFALLSDGVWLVLFVVGAVVLIGHDHSGLSAIMALWAGCGAVTGLAVLAFWGPARSGRPGLEWLRENWHLSWRFAGSFAAAQLSALIITIVVRSMLGPVTLGAVIAAQTLTRPYTTVESAVVGAGVAEIANSTGGSGRHSSRSTAMALTIAVVNGAFMLLLPNAIGARLLGQTWHASKPFLLPLAAQIVAMALSVGPRVTLIASGRADALFRISLGFIPVLIAATMLGAATGSGVTAVWAVTLSWLALAVLWWVVAAVPQRRRAPALG